MVAGAQILTDEFVSKPLSLNNGKATSKLNATTNAHFNQQHNINHDDDDIERSNAQLTAKPFKNPPIIYLMSILSAMGGFLFGYDTGIVSGAMVFIKDYFQLNSLWQELVVSITILGAWMLSIFAGNFSERYGRKGVILWASVIFALGSVIMGFAWSKWVLLLGRLVVGLAIGLASTTVPMYIAEVAPSEIRGSLVTLNNCFITFGQFTAAVTAGVFSADKVNGWRWMLSLAAFPSIVQFFGFLFMPESPRWLIRREKNDEAFLALQRIRGKDNPNLNIEFEQFRLTQLEHMKLEARRKSQKRSILVAIFRKTATRRALLVGCLLQAIQQISGINTIMYYAGTIFEMSGVQSQSMAVWLVVPTSFAYVVFSFCGYLVADRVGRRTLTLTSLFFVIIFLLILGLGFQLKSMDSARILVQDTQTATYCFNKIDCHDCIRDSRCGFCHDRDRPEITMCLSRSLQHPESSSHGSCHLSKLANSTFTFVTRLCPSTTRDGISFNTWLVLGGLVGYLAVFAPGIGPMPWAINSEIYPMWARGICYSIATSVNWLFNLIVSLTFISLSELITTHGSFYLYAILSSIGWLLLFWKLPETRGRSLEEVTQLFAKDSAQDSSIIDSDPPLTQDDTSSAFDNNSLPAISACSSPRPTTKSSAMPSPIFTFDSSNVSPVKQQQTPQQLDVNSFLEANSKKINGFPVVNFTDNKDNNIEVNQTKTSNDIYISSNIDNSSNNNENNNTTTTHNNTNNKQSTLDNK